METKGRRSLRASGPIEPSARTVKPVETPRPEKELKAAESSRLAEPPVASGPAIETAVNLAAAAEPMAPAPNIAPLPPASNSANFDQMGSPENDGAAALAQSQAALARGLEALSAEMAGLALSGMNELARAATKLLAVKTLSDAIEVNTGFTRNSFDALVAGSAKLSELGVKLATETSQPLLSQLGKGWSKVARPGG
jgi:phasin family protein